MPFSALFTLLAQTTAGQAAPEAAPAAAAAAGGGWTSILMIAGLFLFLYFMIMRPQSKKAKEHQLMLGSLKKGDKVYTSGGIQGTVIGLDERELTVEIAPKIRVKVLRSHISHKSGGTAAPEAQAEKKKD